MVRIDTEVHGAIQLFVGANLAEGGSLSKGAVSLDL
jgi:hypothetical protein